MNELVSFTRSSRVEHPQLQPIPFDDVYVFSPFDGYVDALAQENLCSFIWDSSRFVEEEKGE